MHIRKIMGDSSGRHIIFLYLSILTAKYRNVHNFRLYNAYDFIFGHKHNINKWNIFWKFRENPTWWRHVTSCDVIFEICAQKVLTSSKICTISESILFFRMWIHNRFSTRGQPLFYDKRFSCYRIFSKCRILMTSSLKMLTSANIMTS